jgi:hypothetical protein
VSWQPVTLPRLRDLDPEGIILTPVSHPRQIGLKSVR